VEVERRGEEQTRLNAELKLSSRATLNLMQDAVLAKDRLEQVNQKLQLEIAERQCAEAQLQRTLADLERSNQELEQFAYVASHDLQEPLRMVSSYTQLLARRYEGQLDDKAKKYINYAVDGAVRMQMLINDLLAYSRVGSRGKPLEPTDSHSTLGEAIRNLAAMIEENRANITNDDLPTVLADASQLVLVFQNLIANAIKFRRQDLPHVHVSAQDHGREWVFSFKDNGIGIEPQHAERVFVIFQRLHTREEYPGTGIGLAVCKRIVERHGGKIWFESEPGNGATFFFTVPK
jgi:light-regulated signal transduction histidine kinase (bacteriophytochrome)